VFTHALGIVSQLLAGVPHSLTSVSHVSPVQAAEHSQRKPLTPSTQRPPLAQGLVAQSSMLRHASMRGSPSKPGGHGAHVNEPGVFTHEVEHTDVDRHSLTSVQPLAPPV
jgi:hypothetical protein